MDIIKVPIKKLYESDLSITEEVTKEALDSTFNIHTSSGPGLVESGNEMFFSHELIASGLNVANQISIPISNGDIPFYSGLGLVLLIEKSDSLEIKAVEKIIPLYEAQALTLLKLTETQIGLSVYYYSIYLRDGINRLVN